MQKTDWYKIGAIVIVLAFAFEGISSGMLRQGGNKNGNRETPALDLSGRALANVTLARYEPYVIVEGNESAIAEVKEALLASGNATYAIKSGESTIVSLKSGKSVQSAAALFEGAGAEVTASATVTLPARIGIGGNGVTTTVPGGASFTMKIRPVYAEGEVVPASFDAIVKNGELVSVGNFQFVPLAISGARVNVILVGAPSYRRSIEVSWQDRARGKALAAESNASYKERSYVLVTSSAGADQISALLAEANYVTSAQPGSGVVSVRNDFSDVEMANATLSRLGFEPVFPPSTASFANSTGEEEAKLYASMAEAGIEAMMAEKAAAAAKFPEEFVWGGITYLASNFELVLELPPPIAANASNGTLAPVVIDFEAAGKRVTRITSVKVAAE